MLWKHKKSSKKQPGRFDQYHGDLAEALDGEQALEHVDAPDEAAPGAVPELAENAADSPRAHDDDNDPDRQTAKDGDNLPEDEAQYLKD
ncbi:MAG: hypothetical protein ACR2NP_06825, partial [Pirellulaceae bacterium]